MAKDTFLLSMDDLGDIEKLSDRDAGQLLKSIVAYHSSGVLPDKLSVRADMMFGYIRRRLDRNREHYEEVCRKRAAAGSQGGRPKKDASE